MPSDTFYGGHANDDGFANAYLSNITYTFFSQGTDASNWYHKYSFFRFQDVTIPAGATITTATMSVYDTGGAWNANTNFTFAAEDTANPGQITSYSNWSSRQSNVVSSTYALSFNSTFSAYENWTVTNTIQDVVNISGFASGNSVMIFFKSRATSNRTRNDGQTYGAANPPKLYVEWEAVATSNFFLMF